MNVLVAYKAIKCIMIKFSILHCIWTSCLVFIWFGSWIIWAFLFHNKWSNDSQSNDTRGSCINCLSCTNCHVMNKMMSEGISYQRVNKFHRLIRIEFDSFSLKQKADKIKRSSFFPWMHILFRRHSHIVCP